MSIPVLVRGTDDLIPGAMPARPAACGSLGTRVSTATKLLAMPNPVHRMARRAMAMQGDLRQRRRGRLCRWIVDEPFVELGGLLSGVLRRSPTAAGS